MASKYAGDELLRGIQVVAVVEGRARLLSVCRGGTTTGWDEAFVLAQ